MGSEIRKAYGKGESIKELNNHLATLKVKVFEARLSLIENNKPITADSIKKLLTGRVEKSKTILEVFKNHNEQLEDIEISSLDYEFITEYEFWLKSVRKCNHNSTMKYIRNFRKIINGCIRPGWLTKDPFSGFKISLKEVEIIPLSQEDLKALTDKEFSCERLD